MPLQRRNRALSDAGCVHMLSPDYRVGNINASSVFFERGRSVHPDPLFALDNLAVRCCRSPIFVYAPRLLLMCLFAIAGACSSGGPIWPSSCHCHEALARPATARGAPSPRFAYIGAGSPAAAVHGCCTKETRDRRRANASSTTGPCQAAAGFVQRAVP